jgi:hypothetical protein
MWHERIAEAIKRKDMSLQFLPPQPAIAPRRA